jgi:hypothetical protein
MFTPSQPRRTLPPSCNWATMLRARLDGMEKPMPMEPPVGE